MIKTSKTKLLSTYIAPQLIVHATKLKNLICNVQQRKTSNTQPKMVMKITS